MKPRVNSGSSTWIIEKLKNDLKDVHRLDSTVKSLEKRFIGKILIDSFAAIVTFGIPGIPNL